MELPDILLCAMVKMRLEAKEDREARDGAKKELAELSTELYNAEEMVKAARDDAARAERDIDAVRNRLRDARTVLGRSAAVNEKFLEVFYYIMNMFRFVMDESSRAPDSPQLDASGWRKWTTDNVLELVRLVGGFEDEANNVLRDVGVLLATGAAAATGPSLQPAELEADKLRL